MSDTSSLVWDLNVPLQSPFFAHCKMVDHQKYGVFACFEKRGDDLLVSCVDICKLTVLRSPDPDHPNQKIGDLKGKAGGIVFPNARFLEFLVEYRDFIPPEFRGVTVCFLGTTFAHANGSEFVSCLEHIPTSHNTEETFTVSYRHLDSPMTGCAAAVLKLVDS